VGQRQIDVNPFMGLLKFLMRLSIGTTIKMMLATGRKAEFSLEQNCIRGVSNHIGGISWAIGERPLK
jgi:hypothetical protein